MSFLALPALTWASLRFGPRGTTLRDRIEATGGRFGVDSELGRGTRIWAEIPAAMTPAEDDAGAQP
jgi:hypothetical protein